MKNQLHALPLVGALLLGACAPLETRIDESPIENAATKADHETLATYYELKAKELTSKAEGDRHKARVYGALPYGAPKGNFTFAQYYNTLASRLEDAAKQSLSLAKQHREQALMAQK
ncbi:MAG: hypothetical protein ACREX4_23110 [Gammaproteobacteria bacterium]